MDQIRKMALIPADLATQMQSIQAPCVAQALPQTAAGRQLSRLDTEMKRILEDPTLPDDVKIKLYAHTLSQYDEIKSEVRKPLKMEINETQGPKATPPPSATGTLLAHAGSIPTDKKESARKLADFLERNVKWTDRGELIVDGQPVDGTNIHDLFDFVTRNRSTASPPVGFQNFCAAMDALNAPMSIIGNKSLKKGQQWTQTLQRGRGYKARKPQRSAKVKKPAKKAKKTVIRFEKLFK